MLRARFETPAGEAALGGIGIGLGALLFAGTLDDHYSTWWPGIIGGLVCALSPSRGRARCSTAHARAPRRREPRPRALPLRRGGRAAASPALSVLIPPRELLAIGFFVWLLAGGRRREGEKYAGLRILR